MAVRMSPPSAAESLRFAFQRELVKLYLVLFLAITTLSVTEDAFFIIPDPRLRGLVSLLFSALGWGLISGSAVSILHFVVVQTQGSR